jgi:Mrp family chromosome partitioning ATPase
MLFKKNPQKSEPQAPELVLPSPDGKAWATFPFTVVNPMRRLISRLSRRESIPERISFVSTLRQEGVTYISWAFATTLAYDLKTSVCIVDLNWWWPSELSRNLASSKGLGCVLTGETSLDEAIVCTGKPNLAILPAGELSLQERSLFARSAALRDVIHELGTRYEHLVLDIPSVIACSDAIPLASLGSACCMVIHQGVTSITEVKAALSDLDHIPQLGVVMNKLHLDIPRSIQRVVDPYSS